MAGTPGNFAQIYVNGYEFTQELGSLTYNHALAQLALPEYGTGIEAKAPGKFQPALTIKGLRKRNTGVVSAHDILSPNTSIGNVNDTDFIVTALLGQDAPPVAGDPAIANTFGLLNYHSSPDHSQSSLLDFTASFKGRGKRGALRNSNLYNQVAAATGTFSTTPFDRGAAASAGTTKGGVAVLQCFTPTGTAASGTATITGPANNDTIVINGTTYTWKTAIATTNDILIGSSVSASALNLYAALIGSKSPAISGVAFWAGSTALPSTCTVSIAGAVITFKYATTGTGGNAFTLVRTGTGVTLSGATLAGGAAGDSYVVTLLTATTSGGSYTVNGTFTSTLQNVGAERIEIPLGTTLNEWVKLTFTTAGSTNKPGVCVTFGDFYQQ